MRELLYILEEISLPILLPIATGFGFQKIFKLKASSFSRLMIYLMAPVMLFTKDL